MTTRLFALQAIFLAAMVAQAAENQRHMIVIDPDNSHAAAVFAHQIPDVSNIVHVYAPLGQGVTAFLDNLSAFNNRPQNPTSWQIESHITPDFLKLMLHEPPGNIAIITGPNNLKIGRILANLRAGQNVIADKPWIIDRKDFSQLEDALNTAERKHLAVYDGMTERFNLIYQLQKELMRDPDVFGVPLAGTPSEPAVELENIHSLVKFSHGKVSLRPPAFLDVRQQGEAIADVGTHLVDLEMLTLFPDRPIDYKRDIRVLKAAHSPIFLTLPEFERLTGAREWPTFLQSAVRNNRLQYDCNNTALYTLRGIHTAISDHWEYESAGALSDTYLVLYRGTHSTIRVRQSKLENYIAEIDVIPNTGENVALFTAALERRLKQLSNSFPDLTQRNNGRAIRVSIPAEDRARAGSTFGRLVEQFLKYVHDPATIPNWEKPNMLAKYYLTTAVVDRAGKPR
jgi:predicted dehydrogenase